MVEKSGNTHQPSPWESVASGTAAAILANVLVYPLDIVKTRLQVQVQQKQNGDDQEKGDNADSKQYDNAIEAIRQIIQEEGISGLYNGLGSSVLGTASMNFAYFFWSATARDAYQSVLRLYNQTDSNSIIKELGLGAVGGALAQLCTNPISVVITRQQTRHANDEKKGIWETITEIVQSEDGWTGLWRGFKVNLILVVNPMITYGSYQWLRGRLFNTKKNISSKDAFILGALSKVMATIATHPLIVAKTMLQSKPPECRQGKPFRSFTEVLHYILKNEGLLRLYKGLLPQISKGFLVQGLMMALKERTEMLIFLALAMHRRRMRSLLG